jgi:hypothetical protein
MTALALRHPPPFALGSCSAQAVIRMEAESDLRFPSRVHSIFEPVKVSDVLLSDCHAPLRFRPALHSRTRRVHKVQWSAA